MELSGARDSFAKACGTLATKSFKKRLELRFTPGNANLATVALGFFHTPLAKMGSRRRGFGIGGVKTLRVMRLAR
jgi:hypothetical protein